MSLTDSQRLSTRLLALNLRLAELRHELERTQIRVRQLETSLEDARMARLMGEESRDLGRLGTELEQSRTRLEDQRELVESVKKNQWKARVDYTLARVRERRAERRRAEDAADR